MAIYTYSIYISPSTSFRPPSPVLFVAPSGPVLGGWEQGVQRAALHLLWQSITVCRSWWSDTSTLPEGCLVTPRPNGVGGGQTTLKHHLLQHCVLVWESMGGSEGRHGSMHLSASYGLRSAMVFWIAFRARAPGSEPPCAGGWAALVRRGLQSDCFKCSLRNLLHSRLRLDGKQSFTRSQSPETSPRESASTGLSFDATLSNHGKMRLLLICAHVAPAIKSPLQIEELPFTSAAWPPALSMK